MKAQNYLEVRELKKYFPNSAGLFRRKQYIKAVDGVTFQIKKGETFGLVGESGCGKTTVGRTIVRLYEPTSGSIKMDGIEISNMKEKEMRPIRRKFQMIFQDPYASLDPRKTVRQIVEEPLTVHNICPKSEYRDRVVHYLELVGLGANHLSKFPHEFSGGQRQRIGIARALITNPEFIVCDEPISALDVSIQAQVVNMLQDLQEEMGLTYLFIAHDLAMVKYISKHMGVMYLGHLVEISESKELYKSPLHPYTKGLMDAVPIADPIKASQKKRVAMEGDIPSPMNPPPGCSFSTRCPYCMKRCKEEAPVLREISEGHFTACHLY